MAAEMTKAWLLERCKAQGLYRTPNLNDSLYLQCQAVCDIQNLDEYTGVKQLHLEENCLESLNGLQPLKQLQCLYLHKNFVRAIDHLEELEFLDTLDLSQNCLSKLDNLSKCSKLRVLVVSHNLLDSVASIEHLTLCPSIMILDLSHNKLKDGDGVLGVTKSLANLTVLYLSGNPFVGVFPHYRKVCVQKLIGVLDKLSHLDDKPVFWDERRYAEAWMRGGQEEESRERERVREMRATEETLQFEAMRQLRCQAMEDRQFMAHRPMLQFTPEELGEDESQASLLPDNIDQASIRQIEVQDGTEESRVANVAFPFAEVGERYAEGGDQGDEGYSTSHSEVEASYSLEHDLMLAQDQQQLWEADRTLEHDSMVAQDISQQWEADNSHSKHDTMLALDQSQQCYTEALKERGPTVYTHRENEVQSSTQSAERNHAELLTTSRKCDPTSMQLERMVQTQNKMQPAACPGAMLQNLGAVCLPACKSPCHCVSNSSVEKTTGCNSDHHEAKPNGNTCHPREPPEKQGSSSPLPQELGNDLLEWNTYYNNPSFCVGQQYSDSLLSLQSMNNQTEPNCDEGNLKNTSSFCGIAIDHNYLLSMHTKSDIEKKLLP